MICDIFTVYLFFINFKILIFQPKWTKYSTVRLKLVGGGGEREFTFLGEFHFPQNFPEFPQISNYLARIMWDPHFHRYIYYNMDKIGGKA